MANNCAFNMKITGFRNEADRKLISDMFDIGYNRRKKLPVELSHRIYESLVEDQEDGSIVIYGDCAWSVRTALREQFQPVRTTDGAECISIEELSRRYGVTIEYYSEELGMEFQEHCIIRGGNAETDGETHVEEHYPLGPDGEEDDSQEAYKIGGYGDWEWHI